MAKEKQKQKRERPFEVSRLSPGLIGLNVLYQRNKDFEFWVLLRGDGHCDNPASNIDAQIKHLDQAKERGAAVIDIGDQFDAMQGKNDPRRSKTELKAGLVTAAYFDKLVEQQAEFWAPYAENLAVFGYGNHETKVLEKNELDLIQRTAALIHFQNGVGPIVGSWGGFVKIRFNEGRKQRNNHCFIVHYTHGTGGGSRTTRGVGAISKREYITADVIVSGHSHNIFYVPNERVYVSTNNLVTTQRVYNLSVGGYKADYNLDDLTWERTKEFGPSLGGAWWLRFSWEEQHLRLGVHEAIA